MRPKHLFLFLFLAILLSCGKEHDEVLPTDPIPTGSISNSEIVRFSVGSISEGRSVQMTNENFLIDGRTVGVFAYKHAGELSDSVEIDNVRSFSLKYDGTSWNYFPYLYWPNSQDTLFSFLSVYPYTDSNIEFINNGGEGLSFTYNIGDSSSEQKDVLYAISKNRSFSEGNVELNFKHALSKVAFQIAGSINGSDIDSVCITQVSIDNIVKSGTMNVEKDLSKATWEADEFTSLSLFNGSKKIGLSVANVGEVQFLIPQSLVDTPVKVSIIYSVYSNDSTTPHNKKSEFNLPTTIVNKWEENSSYNYSLALNLSEVEFNVDVNVSEFEQGSDENLIVPQPQPETALPETGELNVIYYRTIDGNIIEPNQLVYDTELWGGAQIISNTYENGYGKMEFDIPVTRIANSVFYSGDWENNSTLLEIILPKSVKEIGVGAFERCIYLKEIALGDSITTINGWAFNSCTSLKSIYIPKSVTRIDSTAFSYFGSLMCSIEEIVVDENNTIYDSRDNCNAIIETATNKMLIACNTTVIPNSVVAIGGYAFYYKTVSEIILPKSLLYIGTNVFVGCELTELTIPENVEYIGRGALSAPIVNFESTIPIPFELENDIFENNYGLTTINVPESAINDYANADGWVKYRHLISGYIESELNIVKEIVDTISIPYDNKGYTGGIYSFSIDEIYNAFDITEEEYTNSLSLGRWGYRAEDVDGTLHTTNGNTDFSSWWGDDGYVKNWGADARIFFEGLHPNNFTVGQYPGHVSIGDIYPTSHLITYFSNGELKAIRLRVTVEIVES